METNGPALLSICCTFLVLCAGSDSHLPQFVTHPKEYSYIIKQEAVTLTCEAYDAEEITYSCLDVKMDTNRQQTYQSFDPETSRTLVKTTINVTYNDVKGVQDFWCECYAWKSAGSMEDDVEGGAQYSLSRRGFVMIPYLDKAFVKDPKSQSVAEDSSVELKCTPPSGNPEPTIVWKKNGHLIHDSADSNVILSNHGSLVIEHFDVTNEGSYTCVAKNIAGKITSTAASLSLNEYMLAGETDLYSDELADEPEAEGAIFLIQPESQNYVTDETPVDMTCHVKGANILEFRCNGVRVDESKIQKEESKSQGGSESLIKSVYTISVEDIKLHEESQRSSDFECTCYAWYMQNGQWAGKETPVGKFTVAGMTKNASRHS